MSLGAPIPVRFSDSVDSRLAAISAKTGLPKAELIRLATDEFLDKIAQTGEIVQRIRVQEATHSGVGNINQNFTGQLKSPITARSKNSSKKKSGVKK